MLAGGHSNVIGVVKWLQSYGFLQNFNILGGNKRASFLLENTECFSACLCYITLEAVKYTKELENGNPLVFVLIDR